MKTLVSILSLSIAASMATAQDVIYYPFTSGTGTAVTNLGSGPAGTLNTANTTNSGWVTGRADNALAGKDATSTGSWVDTGFTTAVSGSFTIAFFMKESLAVANSLSYQISGRGSFRMFTGGVAYEGFYLRAWGGQPADLVLRAPGNRRAGEPDIDLRSMAANDWVHVALVVDATAMRATYYVNGSPFSTTTITQAANIPAGGAFRVGMHTGTTSRSNQHLDDFRFSTRAVPAHEIQGWAQAKMIADKTEVSVAATDSQRLNIRYSGTGVQQYWIFGSLTGTWPQFALGGFNVPLAPDAYTTLAMGLVNNAVFVNYRSVLANGTATARFQLPANTPPSAIGATIYQAALIYDFSGNVLDVTNAVPTTIVK